MHIVQTYIFIWWKISIWPYSIKMSSCLAHSLFLFLLFCSFHLSPSKNYYTNFFSALIISNEDYQFYFAIYHTFIQLYLILTLYSLFIASLVLYTYELCCNNTESTFIISANQNMHWLAHFLCQILSVFSGSNKPFTLLQTSSFYTVNAPEAFHGSRVQIKIMRGHYIWI